MRRLLILASTMIFLDVVFFSAIAPLLPEYADDLGLSDAQAGILSAAYAAGTLLAALPGGWVASQVGPRKTTIVGLGLLGVSSLAFGFAEQIVLLDVARFCQGVAGALVWSGALTWLITTAPEEKRGSVIGTALGTAVAGALLGPALGALAGSIGTEAVFASVLVISLILAGFAARMPEAGTPERQSLRIVAATMVTRPIVLGVVFVAVPSVMFGAVEVLVPLRIDDLGGSHGVIAAGFIAGAALEATLAPLAGRISDRIGRRTPYVAGLVVCAAAMVGVAAAQVLGGVLAALIVTSLGAGLCFAPALTLLSDAAEHTDLHQGFAAGLSNMAWASGQVIGGVGGGVVATLTGDAVPCIAIALLLVGTALFSFRTLPAAPTVSV
ncbi:MAG TPA: MFS transporter, partial [Solirubrobacterales bacterium]|nr:MFS transporter [Solirubrobacterales bacterium]